MKSIYSGFFLIFLALIVFTSINIIGNEIPSNNLDAKSAQVLLAVNKTLVNTINVDDLTETQLINNTNPQDKESFGFEFLTAKSDVDKKVSIINTISNSPDIVIAAAGVNTNDFTEYITIAKWFVGIVLSLILFDAVFTRRVFNK